MHNFGLAAKGLSLEHPRHARQLIARHTLGLKRRQQRPRYHLWNAFAEPAPHQTFGFRLTEGVAVDQALQQGRPVLGHGEGRRG